jgi:Family of unknown function (DUF6317)
MLSGITGGTVMTGMPDEHGQRLMPWTAHSPGSMPKTGRSAQSHLHRAAATFGAQATAFRSIVPVGGPDSVAGGDPDLDHALTQILALIGELHAQLSASVAEHGRGLQRASESAQERS